MNTLSTGPTNFVVLFTDMKHLLHCGSISSNHLIDDGWLVLDFNIADRDINVVAGSQSAQSPRVLKPLKLRTTMIIMSSS